jgi:hypothetical protein
VGDMPERSVSIEDNRALIELFKSIYATTSGRKTAYRSRCRQVDAKRTIQQLALRWAFLGTHMLISLEDGLLYS